MKISFKLVFIILAILTIILISVSSCSQFKPFSFPSSKLHEYTYEGFSDYTTYPNNESIDSFEKNQIADTAPAINGGVKSTGFDGLIGSYMADETPIDMYSQALGDKTCKSYGLTNSNGYLCLSPDQIKSLTTRGGNVSFNDSTIG